jgi:hypothetical protein
LNNFPGIIIFTCAPGVIGVRELIKAIKGSNLTLNNLVDKRVK